MGLITTSRGQLMVNDLEKLRGILRARAVEIARALLLEEKFEGKPVFNHSVFTGFIFRTFPSI